MFGLRGEGVRSFRAQCAVFVLRAECLDFFIFFIYLLFRVSLSRV